MSKIGVSLSIDVTAIDKSKMFTHQNGKVYLDMTVFIDEGSPDNYGNHGMIVQKWKDAPKKGTPILGNAKVFWKDENQYVPNPQSQPAQQSKPPSMDSFDDDIPF